MGKKDDWVGPIGGIIFALATVVAGVIFSGVEAEPSDSAGTVLAQFQENVGDIQTAAFITVLGLGFLMLFLGHFRSRLRAGGAGWAADGFLAGGVAVVGAWTVLMGVQLAAGIAGDSGHAEVSQGAIDFLWNGSFLFSPGLLALGVAAAAASFFSRATPIWLGVLAAVVALGALAPWLGIFVFVAWILTASVVELITVNRPRAAKSGA